jgi:hypothetical protein
VRGRIWLVLGALAGVAVALGSLPYLAGAGRSLADTALRLVNSAASRIIDDAATRGAPRRVVLGSNGVIAVLLPGITALLLVVAARASLRIRAIVAILITALGAASFAYQSHGKASGVLLLALVLAGLAVTLTGPLVAAPLAAVAGIIAGEYLPSLVQSHRKVTQTSVQNLHLAVFDRVGAPVYLQVLMLILAALPFAWAARIILRS